MIAALAAWLIPLAIISVMVARRPLHRSATETANQAAEDWWARKDLYQGHLGMNYLPQFAIVFSPFWAVPGRAPGDILWRVFSTAVLLYGIWRLTRNVFGEGCGRAFFLVSAISLWPCLSSMRNGQANELLSALLVVSTALILEKRWWPAACIIAFSIIIKPLGIVMLGLAVFVYRPLIVPCIIAVLAVALSPFLFGPPDYVWNQYVFLVDNLKDCATVTEHRFADINGIFRTLGHGLPNDVSLVLRPLAGLVVLGLWLFGARRTEEPFRALMFLALSSAYIVVFNPMTEANSYVIVGPAMGIMAVYLGSREKRVGLGWAVAVMVLTIGLLPEPLRRLTPNFSLWWHPTMAILFAGVVFYRAFGVGGKPGNSVINEP